MAARSLDESDYQRLAEFRYRLRRFLKFSEHQAAKIGLNPQQHQALLAIKGAPRGNVTIGILAIDLTNRAERILAKLTLAHRNEVSKLAPLLRRLLKPFESGPRKGRHIKSKTNA